MRSRISCGRLSWMRRAPSLAASTITSGAGVAMATPNHGGKGEAAQRGDLQQQRVLGVEPADGAESHQEHPRGEGGHYDQAHVDGAMQSLPGMAARAL
jgi:hypothetical protein